MLLWYFISASRYTGMLFSFPKTCGGSAVSTFRPWPNLPGFNQQSLHLWVTPTLQFLSLTWFVIILNVTWPKKNKNKNLTFSDTTNSSCSPTHFSLPIELFWTPLPPGPHTLSPNLPLHPLSPKSSIFFFLIATNICILSQQHLLHPSLHYHFNQITLIHTLMRSYSSPVILSIWLFS